MPPTDLSLRLQPVAVGEPTRPALRSVTVPPLPVYARPGGLSIPPLSLDPCVRLLAGPLRMAPPDAYEDGVPDSRSETLEAHEDELTFIEESLAA